MNSKEIERLIRLGLNSPANYFKRSVWVKIERVMEYLVRKGAVCKSNGSIKYKRVGSLSISELAGIYVNSPFTDHMEELKQLSREKNLPLNSLELLNQFYINK